MLNFWPSNRPLLPDLTPVKDALRTALGEADEAERPGLERALAIVEEFASADQAATQDWARKTLAVAGVDPVAQEVKAVRALRQARHGLGLKEAVDLVKSLNAGDS
ncbi:hypothetical protein GCM10010359_34550 [Streptomyces morookaense]|uniref:Uncharacterized protein n=1 Tax=Streptomyces morookaense TaxID=1970 RepID=A0A7Y7B6Y1_STRMO|nr:hypothetical protein [Streptomyces morookaense]GHF29168.1 hypothetical protein GCM10010359_34550 [Streptomyces morookaense]